MIPEQFRYDVMARTVAEVDSAPSNLYEVAVLLEVLGCYKNDRVNSTKLFDVSRQVQKSVPFYSNSHGLNRGTPPAIHASRRSGTVYSSVWSILLIALFSGITSAWIVDRNSIISSLVATAVGLGIVISFIVTGGLQQVFSFRLSYYRLQSNFPLVKKTAVTGYAFGFLAIAMATVIFLLVNWFLRLISAQLEVYTILFLLFLGCYRVLATPLYAYRKFHLIAAGLAAALVCLCLTYYELQTIAAIDNNILTAQLIGLIVLNAVTTVECIQVFSRSDPDETQTQKKLSKSSLYRESPSIGEIRTPRLSIVVFEMLPLFAFGTMFYIFLFFDRILSWISTKGTFLLTYNSSYQLGADLALLILIPLNGVIYWYLDKLSDVFEVETNKTNITDRLNVSGTVHRLISKMLCSIGVLAIISIIVLWQLSQVLLVSGSSVQTVFVFRFALIAYSVLAIFLANTFVSFYFRRYSVPVLLLFLAVLMELCVNVIGHALTSTWNPIYGLLLSVILATIIASLNTLRFIRRADYYQYSAF